MRWTINCDLGEGMTNDAQIMPYLDLCNIACGGHAGDQLTMRHTLELARTHGVRPGAHPSYPDRKHFGRKSVSMSPDALKEALVSQIHDLASISHELGILLTHVKPHGALYNDTFRNEEVASCILEAMTSYPDLALVIPAQSVIARLASASQLVTIYEGFADRRYLTDGTLVPRSHPQAMIHSPEIALAQVRSIVNESSVTSVEGILIPLRASTFCIHGDHPEAVTLAQSLKRDRDA